MNGRLRGFTRPQILLTLLVFALAGFGYKSYAKYHLEQQRAESAERLRRQHAEVQAILSRWSDAIRLAGMTSRIALSQPLSQMQAIRREMDSTRNGECFDKATKGMADAMGNAVFAFEMFIQYPSNSSASDTTSKYLDKSAEGISAGSAQIKDCMEKAGSAFDSP